MSLCSNEKDCSHFSHFGSESFAIANFCILFVCPILHPCDDCSAELRTCGAVPVETMWKVFLETTFLNFLLTSLRRLSAKKLAKRARIASSTHITMDPTKLPTKLSTTGPQNVHSKNVTNAGSQTTLYRYFAYFLAPNQIPRVRNSPAVWSPFFSVTRRSRSGESH